MALIEKLTLKDTFKIWRDKINALIDSIYQQPITDENGNYLINEKYTDATRVLMEIPLTVTTTVTAEKFIGAFEGNASTATVLKEARKINGTLFNGSDNIVTTLWGEGRNFKITDYAGSNIGPVISVNGSDVPNGYTLRLPETIKANVDGFTTTAGALDKTVHINGIKFNGTDNVINYGVCESSSLEQIKQVTLYSKTTEFVFLHGSTITVKFVNKNEATGVLYLNVNGTGRREIYAYGKPIDPDIIDEGSVLTFVYIGDGSSGTYNLISLDKRVRQKLFTNNDSDEHPLLASPIADSTTEIKDDYTFFTRGITINSSTNSLTVDGGITSNTLYAKSSVTTPLVTSLDALSITSPANISLNSSNTLALTATTATTISSPSVQITNGNLKLATALTITSNNTASTITSTNALNISGSSVSVTKGNVSIANKLNVTGETTLKTASVTLLKTTYNNTSYDIIKDGVVYNATYNDYAEFFEKGEETEAGDIVSLDISSSEEKYVKATDKSKLIVGIHSDSYGHILGGTESSVEDNNKAYIPIGLSGRVFVKFKGKSILGEAVVPSDTPGVGRLYDEFLDDKRKIVGYIVYDPEPTTKEIRKVRVLINR